MASQSRIKAANGQSFETRGGVLAEGEPALPVEALKPARDNLQQRGLRPDLLVIPQSRPLLARYARLFAPELNVLSYNEVREGRNVNLPGRWGKHSPSCYDFHPYAKRRRES